MNHQTTDTRAGRWRRPLQLLGVAVLAIVCLRVIGQTADTAAPGEPVADGNPTVEELFAPYPDVVARYDGKTVTRQEVAELLGPQLKVALLAGQDLNAETMRQNMERFLNALIDQRLLLQQAKDAGYAVDTEKATPMVEQQIAQNRQQIEQQLAQVRQEIGEAAYNQRAERLNLDLDAFFTHLKDALTKQMAEALTINQWIGEKLLPTVDVNQAEAKDFYEEHPDWFTTPAMMRASHILVKVEPDASTEEKAAAREEAEALLAKLKEGADFSELAKAESDGPSAAQGGDLGPFSPGQMVKPFENAAADLEPGELSDVVETRFGYHIIKGGEATESMTREFADVEEALIQQLKRQKVGELLENKLKELRDQADVTLMLDAEE